MTQPHVGQVGAADLLTHHDNGYPPAVLARQGTPAPTVMQSVPECVRVHVSKGAARNWCAMKKLHHLLSLLECCGCLHTSTSL